MENLRSYSVFVASPGDLAPERKVFRDTLEAMNQESSAQRDRVIFRAVGWEDQGAVSGRRVQSELDKLITGCDVFFLVLGTRWGEKDPEVPYSSNTEEEYRIAMKLWEEKGSPEVFVFFKHVEEWIEKDAGPELSKIIRFRKELQSTRKVLYKRFNSGAEFAGQVRSHLQAFARGEYKTPDQVAKPAVTFADEATASLDDAAQKNSLLVQKAEAAKGAAETGQQNAPAAIEQAKADLSLVVAYKRDLTLARAAVESANNGEIEEARLLFGQATQSTTDLAILAVASDFYRQVGDPETAARLVQRQSAIAEDRSIAADYYLKLTPSQVLQQSVDMVADTMLPELLKSAVKQLPADLQEYFASECIDVYREIYCGDEFREAHMAMLCQTYTTEELLGMALFLASPVGQSTLRKQTDFQLMLADYARKAFGRILLQRHPEWAPPLEASKQSFALEPNEAG